MVANNQRANYTEASEHFTESAPEQLKEVDYYLVIGQTITYGITYVGTAGLIDTIIGEGNWGLITFLLYFSYHHMLRLLSGIM